MRAPVVVPGVVQHHPHAERLHPAGLGDRVPGAQVIAHDQEASVASRRTDALDRRVVRTAHHHDGIGSRVRVECRLAVPAVHDLQVGDERVRRERVPQLLHGGGPLAECERSADLEPVGARRHGDRGHLEGVVDGLQVK